MKRDDKIEVAVVVTGSILALMLNLVMWVGAIYIGVKVLRWMGVLS